MYKYIMTILLVSVLGLGIWNYPKQEIIEVPVPVESLGLYDDIAILALEVGNLEIAKKYIDKSGNQELLKQYQKHKEVKELVLLSVEKGLLQNNTSKTEVDTVFKRLVSLESLDEVLEGNLDVTILLLLAKVSVEQGFRGWDGIADQLGIISQQLELTDVELSVLLHEISQYRI